MVAPNPQLQPRIAAIQRRAGPCMGVLERVGNNIAELRALAKRPTGIFRRDVVLLRLPANIGQLGRLRVGMEEVVLLQLGENGVKPVAGFIERVPTLACGTG